MSSKQKITIAVLRSMISWHFGKQGKKLSNISKATKPNLLEIVEKYNIDKDEYWKEMEKEEEEEKEEEAQEKIEQDKKEQEKKVFDNKCRIISNLLCKKWYNEFHKHSHKKVIKKIYELDYNKKLANYEYNNILTNYSSCLKTIEKIPLKKGQYELDIIGDMVNIRGNFAMCNVISFGSNWISEPVKKFCWLDREFMKKY
jgi:hypothetical protein